MLTALQDWTLLFITDTAFTEAAFILMSYQMDLSYFRIWVSLLISFQWKDFVAEEAAAHLTDPSSSQAYWFHFSDIILPISIMID